jgi:hypothetical protein
MDTIILIQRIIEATELTLIVDILSSLSCGKVNKLQYKYNLY